MQYLDRKQVYLWWHLFKNDNELVEMRAIANKVTYSGYYKNVENLIRDIEYLAQQHQDIQFYYTLNKIDERIYSRQQSECFVKNPKNTTTDAEIVGRRFILIDLDPVRPAGINSSDVELEYAHEKARDVYRFLRENGFNPSIVCMSSNGWHLNLPVKMAVNDETTKLVKRFLQALSMLFSDEHVEVDEKVFNPSRISKIYGTLGRKGANSAERPWRMSYIADYPQEVKPNDIEYIRKIADMYPEDEVKPNADNHYNVNEKFDLPTFLQKHGLGYRTESVAGGVKYILDHCPFNEQHKGKDAVIFQRDNGAIAFVCLHNGCKTYTWRDVRLKYEPDAYTKKDYAEYEHKRNYYGYRDNRQHSMVQVVKDDEEKGEEWMKLSDVKYVDISSLVHIPTGYTILDKKIMGLLLGDVTVMSGLSGSGKTSWLDCLALNVVDRGVKTAIWSGELQDFRFQSWIDQIAAGKNYVRKKEGYDGLYYCPKQTAERINSWLDDKLLLYNNRWGNKWGQIYNGIRDAVEKRGCKLIILDNLMALNITDYDGDKYSQQTQFINDIKAYAKLWNIHIILVAHPRKEMGFLRKESISGTADLTNLCDNCFIIHRVNRDFKNRGSEFLGAEKINEYLGFDAVLEVAKNRSMGVVDELIGMYYEKESRRLKNEISENIIYGWMEEGKQAEMPIPQQEERYAPSNPTAGLSPNTSFDDGGFPTDPEDEDVPF